MSGEQRFSIGLVCTFLKVYASIFDFLQGYTFKSSKNSSISFRILSVRVGFYCNYMRPANCKEMGIMTGIPRAFYWFLRALLGEIRRTPVSMTVLMALS
jgi:hypothetical protein